MTGIQARRFFVAAAAAAALAAGCGGSLREQQTVGGVASYERGKEAFDRKDYTDAIADLKAYIEQYPGTDYTDEALYYLGRSYFEIKDYVLASGQFDRLLRDFPASMLQPDALYQLARCDDVQSHSASLDQTETLRAISRYRQFLELYPENPNASEARKRLDALNDRLAQKKYLNGRLYVRLKQYNAATVYLTETIAEYPRSRWAGESALLLAGIYSRRGEYAEAAALLRQVPDTAAPAETKREAKEQLREIEKKEFKP